MMHMLNKPKRRLVRIIRRSHRHSELAPEPEPEPEPPATFDFTAGGLIPAANCIQAFDPYIIQDLATSYVDLSENGNNAVVTVPPTLGADGWVFNGVDQFVDTGIIQAYTYSAAITFTYLGDAGVHAVFGSQYGL